VVDGGAHPPTILGLLLKLRSRYRPSRRLSRTPSRKPGDRAGRLTNLVGPDQEVQIEQPWNVVKRREDYNPLVANIGFIPDAQPWNIGGFSRHPEPTARLFPDLTDPCFADPETRGNFPPGLPLAQLVEDLPLLAA
jgi:hypothetical protein